MDIPKRLKVLGHEVEVKYEKNYARDESRTGSSSANSLEILLDPSFSQSVIETTFIHEIIEQLNYHLELHLEHSTISQLEAGLYQVLRDNGLINEGFSVREEV